MKLNRNEWTDAHFEDANFSFLVECGKIFHECPGIEKGETRGRFKNVG